MKPTHECPERRPSTEQISGLIERVTFHSDESGFCVLRVKAKGQRDDITVVGSLRSVTAGEWLSRRLVGEGQGTRPSIQSHDPEDRAADHHRGNRAVSGQRAREGDRPDPRQETGGALRSRRSYRNRKPP